MQVFPPWSDVDHREIKIFHVRKRPAVQFAPSRDIVDVGEILFPSAAKTAIAQVGGPFKKFMDRYFCIKLFFCKTDYFRRNFFKIFIFRIIGPVFNKGIAWNIKPIIMQGPSMPNESTISVAISSARLLMSAASS